MRYRTGKYIVCRRVRLWNLTGLGSEGIKSLLWHHSTLCVQTLATASNTTVALPFIFTLSPSTFSRTSPPRAEHCRAARAHSSYMIRTHTIRTRSKDLHFYTILHVLHHYLFFFFFFFLFFFFLFLFRHWKIIRVTLTEESQLQQSGATLPAIFIPCWLSVRVSTDCMGK